MADIYTMVTQRIIAQLEQEIIPWAKGWGGVRSGAFNRISKKPYSLLNQMLLEHEGEYATLKQWNILGGRVRAGEKAEIVCFWKIMQREEINGDGEKIIKNYPVLRYYNVFHISQVEGVEPLQEELHEVKVIPIADELINDFVNRDGLKYTEKLSNEAFYRPFDHSVTVPCKNQYSGEKVVEFYSTVFHELGHATSKHLNRPIHGRQESTGGYATEELIAEICSASVLNRLNIETDYSFKNSCGYIQGWLKALRDDPKMIVSASGKAQKAVDYIFNEEGSVEA